MTQYLKTGIDELIDSIRKHDEEISILKEAVSLLGKRGHRDLNKVSDEIESQNK